MFDTSINLVKNYVKTEKLPSAALSIGIGSNFFVTETFGKTSYTKEGILVNKETLYDLASLTKIVATLPLVLKRLSIKEFNLEDTLYDFFGYQVPRDKRAITLQQLLTHTAGFPQHLRLEEHIKSPRDSLELLLSTPLIYKPGVQTIYDDISFMLLGEILKRISGKSLEELTRNEIFLPLNMHNTGYRPINKTSDNINIAFTERSHITGKWLRGIVHDENTRFLGGVAGHAGLFSNIKDMTKFVNMLACGGKLSDGTTFIDKTILERSIRNYTKDLDGNRGLGFELTSHESGPLFDKSFDNRAYGHTGFTGTHFTIAPSSGLYIVLLTNRVHPTRENINHLKLRKLLKRSVQKEFKALRNKML